MDFRRVSSISEKDCDLDDFYLALEQNITSLRTALHEEIRQRHRMIADIGGLRRAAVELSEQRALDVETFQRELDSLTHQHKVW